MADWQVEAARPLAIVAARAPPGGPRGGLPATRGRPADARASPARGSAQALVESFNTWSFKREQPDNPALLTRLAEEAIEQLAPLAFVLYWGRGPRADFAAPESQCLDFLASLAGRVRSRHPPGAEVTIICTDTHAALNGHSPTSTTRYFAAVEREAAARGIKACQLSDVVVRTQNAVDRSRGLEPPHPELLRALTASAGKWYRGGLSPEEGARLYYQANMIEKQAVQAAFPKAVFITFNGSDLRPLFPDAMPIFYMYSIRRGVAVKPWFMAAEPEAAAQALEVVR